MIEKPPVQIAKDTDLYKAISIGINESLTALKESFYDLRDEQAWAFPLKGRNNIAWIVMHSLLNLDMHGCYTPRYLTLAGDGDHRISAIDWRRYNGQFDMDNPPKLGDTFPSVQQMLEIHGKVETEIEEVLSPLTSEILRKPIKDCWVSASDAYMRTIWHTAAHVRQIWLLRGLLGWQEGQSWPHQHWA